MHKDQQRVKEDLIPVIQNRWTDSGGANERDCTMLVRLFLQGPDPIFLMEACPGQFLHLCRFLGLSVGEGREAIETAHWNGPGALLNGTGLPRDTMPEDAPLSHRKEALWLVMASLSECTEGGYSESTTMLERIKIQARAISEFSHFVWPDESFCLGPIERGDIRERAVMSMCKFIDKTPFTPDPLFGIPMATEDYGFYVGYKLGHPAVAVKADGMTFYGTVPSTSLEEQGITVDKQISPQFGIVFDTEAA